MKLTKGKISKLYRKNKQSLKRYKKMETNKNKSFRKRGHVNLRNKSLKNYRGGQDKVDTLKPIDSSNVQDGKNKTAELLSEASDELNDGDNAVVPETLKQEQKAISQVSPELGESPKKEDLDIDSYPSDLTQEPLPEPSSQLETNSSNNQNESTALLEKEATTEGSLEQTESTQKVLEDLPEVTDSEAAASPFLAEVKTEKEEGGPEQTNVEQQSTQEGGPEQTELLQEALPEVTDSQAEASPFLAEVKTEKEEGLTEFKPDQTGDESGAQTSEESGAQTSEESGAQTSDESGAQVGEESGAQVSEESGAQVEEAQVEGTQVDGAQTGEESVGEETGPAQIGEEGGLQTTALEQSVPSTEGLPENVSIAAKTILDYAMGSLAKQINSGSTISQGLQNPESSFTNMTNTFASQGGRSLKNKLRVKGKKTRKH